MCIILPLDLVRARHVEELIEEEDVEVLDNTDNESPTDSVETVAAAAKRTTSHVPYHVPYLLIGAGTASFAAYR